MSHIDQVMAAVEKSAQEAVTVTLGYSQLEIVDSPASLLDKSCGAFIPLTEGPAVMHIGVLADAAGGADLAEKLMGQKPASAAEEADALGEIVNIIAGGIKRRLSEWGTSLQLGLPFSFNGEIYFKEPIEIAMRRCVADGVNLLLVVIIKKESRD